MLSIFQRVFWCPFNPSTLEWMTDMLSIFPSELFLCQSVFIMFLVGNLQNAHLYRRILVNSTPRTFDGKQGKAV